MFDAVHPATGSIFHAALQSSVFEDRAALNLDEFQRKQAESKSNELKSTVDARLVET